MARTGPDAARVVLELENTLCDAKMVDDIWMEQLQDPWRRSLNRINLTVKDVAMHMAAFQYFVKEADELHMTRVAFMRQVQALR